MAVRSCLLLHTSVDLFTIVYLTNQLRWIPELLEMLLISLKTLRTEMVVKNELRRFKPKR